MFAKVLVDLKAKEVNRLFDYIIPSELTDKIKRGMRVIVPFNEQIRLGFVIEITNSSNLANKEIIESMDIIPTINDETFLYLDYLNKTNQTLYISVLETILPNELFLDYEQYLIVKDKDKINNKIKHYFSKEKILINKELKLETYAINKSIEEGGLILKREFRQKAKPKIMNKVFYNNIKHHYKNIDNYTNLIDYVINHPGLTKKELTEENFSLSSVNTLIKNNVFKIIEDIVSRDVIYKDTNKIPFHKLNKEQQIAFNEIKDNLNKNIIHLLFGITGSGKTEVYMHVINEVLKNNQKVLYLVPEISLVAPTVNYLKSRFNEVITHYNSSLSKGERHDAWVKIIEDEATIIVGTRSSAFLPINNLGVIIVDEEHDESYNQSDRVQYNLIDIIKIKANYFNIPIILGSATPKVSSMYYAQNKKYNLLKLTKRATNQPLPNVSFVNMKDELKNGNTTIFSKLLKQKIKERLKNKEQTILLFNRKGFSSFLLCRNCGHVPKCPHCDVSLTYFKDENELRCSYCNHKEKRLSTCSSCGSNKIGEIGMGVEQVYEQVLKTFKDARVVLMDLKTTSRKGSHEQIWLDFKDHKYDILVGTQMVSKGLDFKDVTLVGILMADLELKVPNYLASEQTYNLLTQMVGRSGRQSFGEAIIQGYDLDHYAISSVNKPYEDFYKQALFYREVSKYEPFYEMVQILVSNKSYLKTYQDALNIKKRLNNYIVLGPTEPVIKFVKDEYRFIITIKSKNINYQEIINIINDYQNSSNIRFIKNQYII